MSNYSFVLVKENSKTRVAEKNDNTFEAHDREEHLCWQWCANAYATRCGKVMDPEKKPINEYEYIKTGYQIIDDAGEIDRFIVKECENYEYQHQPNAFERQKKLHLINEPQKNRR